MATNDRPQKSYWKPGDSIDPAANAERISDRQSFPCGCTDTIFGHMKHKIEENIAETQAVNAALRSGDQSPSLLRRAKSLSRLSGRFSELATFITAVHNERPYVRGAVA
jgi:hypothetical protein